MNKQGNYAYEIRALVILVSLDFCVKNVIGWRTKCTPRTLEVPFMLIC